MESTFQLILRHFGFFLKDVLPMNLFYMELIEWKLLSFQSEIKIKLCCVNKTWLYVCDFLVIYMYAPESGLEPTKEVMQRL